MEWKLGFTDNPIRIVDIRIGNKSHPLQHITDLVVDEDSIFVCDSKNRRVLLWSSRYKKTGDVFISDVDCKRLALDDQGALYFTADWIDEVKRYDVSKINGTVVAGGNGRGNALNQLDQPTAIAVDRDYSVYVCDVGNSRIMKWTKDAVEGIVIADRQDVDFLAGIFIDSLGTLYAIGGLDKVMRWPKGKTEGETIVGGRCSATEEHQIFSPYSFAFDPNGNLYVAHWGSQRTVQKFELLADQKTCEDTSTFQPFHFSCSAACPNITGDSRWSHQTTRITAIPGTYTPHTSVGAPVGLCLDQEGDTVYIADQNNDRIIESNFGSVGSCGIEVVAGGRGRGDENNQLFGPRHVIVDRDSLVICDYYNRRVMRWPRQNGTHGTVILENINCAGLALDDQNNLYVTNTLKDEVRRYELDDTIGTLVAGGNSKGSHLHQLNDPRFIFVDENQSVYVSDTHNHRVMKWMKGAREGIIVAGGHGKGNSSIQLNHPNGILVDRTGTVYVADGNNHRVMRWPKHATEGSSILNMTIHNEYGHEILIYPEALSFDRYGNLYITDSFRNEATKFFILH